MRLSFILGLAGLSVAAETSSALVSGTVCSSTVLVTETATATASPVPDSPCEFRFH